MGEHGLYDLRDELLIWKNKNGYGLKSDVPENIPDKFISETLNKISDTNMKILSILGR
jgi:hypothetical protein